MLILSSFCLFSGCKKQNVENDIANSYSYDVSGDPHSLIKELIKTVIFRYRVCKKHIIKKH